jgi:hypothetical protein
MVVSLCGVHLLGDGLVGWLVADALEALAFDLGELDAVGGVGDVEVKHGPDELRQLVSPGKRPITLVRRLTSPSDLSSRFVDPPPPAVSGVAQVHDERVEVVGEASGCGGVAGLVELVDQRLESLLSVALVGRVVQCLPVGPADALTLARLSELLCVRSRRLVDGCGGQPG